MSSNKNKVTGTLIGFALKFGMKAMSLLCKFGKSAKVAKFAWVGASMAGYCWAFSWQFAAAIMTMLFVHEYGHVWQMRREGMKVRGIYFIPFMGGAAVTDDAFPSRVAEAKISLMGPIFGLGLIVLSSIAYIETLHPLWAVLGGWMSMVNIFNLLPINPLDGGRCVKSAMFSTYSYVGITFLLITTAIGVVLSIYLGILVLGLLMFFAIFDIVLEWSKRNYGSHWMLKMNIYEIAATLFVYASLIIIHIYFIFVFGDIPGADAAKALLMD